MKYSDTIFQLVKSLSKQEKIYFKSFASNIFEGDGSNYLKFFDEIVRQASKAEEYNEDKIRKLSFTGKFLKNFAYHKNYLYNTILFSMTLFNIDKDIYLGVVNQLSQVKFLENKALYDQALKILLKAKATAYENELYKLLYEILSIEKSICNHILSLEETKKKQDRVTAEQKDVLNIIQSNLEFNILYKKIGYLTKQSGTGLIRQEEISRQYEEIINSDIMSSESNARTIQSKFMYKTIKLQYHLSLADSQNEKMYAEEILQLFEENFGKGENFYERYIISLNNVLLAHVRVGKYDQMDEIILKMRNFEKQFPDKITESIKGYLFYSRSVSLIPKYLRLGEYDKLKVHISETVNDLTVYETKMTLQLRIIVYYFLGISNFVLAEYDECIQWMGKIINQEKSEFSEQYQSHCRIVYLLSYYELKYFDSMEYVLKSTYHFMSKRKFVYKYENIILKYLRKSFRVKTEKELYEMFEEMRYELKKIYDDQFEKNAFDAFNILYWLESKLDRIPLMDVLKNKA